MRLLLQAGGLGGFWDTYGSSIRELAIMAGGILVYALIVNAFYQIISKRVMFGKKDATGRVFVGGPGRGFLYLLLFPLISLAFFILLSASLLFLSDVEELQTSAAETRVTLIFTLAMGIVLAVRVAAYFSEPTSHDLAKMLPLGLLGVFLVNFDTQGLIASLSNIRRLFESLDVIAIFFAIVVIVEYLLRIIYLSVQASRRPRVPKPRGPTAPQQMRGQAPYQPPAQGGHNQPPPFRR